MKARVATKRDMPESREEELLTQMLVQGAGLAECRVAAPGVPLATLEELQRRAPSAADPAPDDRPWTKKEDAALRSRIPRRTAEQIRRAALPWRTPSAIRMRASELGLSWGNIPSRPAAAPPPLAASSPPSMDPAAAPEPVLVPSLPSEAAGWTAAQDRELCVLAGTVPFLVLRNRLAEKGPVWSRQHVRERFNLLKQSGRVKTNRSLVFCTMTPEHAKAIETSLKQAPRHALPAGYTSAMLRRLAPQILQGLAQRQAAKPVRSNQSRRAAAARLKFSFPTSREAVLGALRSRGLTPTDWARAHGVEPDIVQYVLMPRKSRRVHQGGKALAVAVKLGIAPPQDCESSSKQSEGTEKDRRRHSELASLRFTYPMTPQQVRSELKKRRMPIRDYAAAHGLCPFLVYRALKGQGYSRKSKGRDVAIYLGLLPVEVEAKGAVCFAYPSTRDDVLDGLAARGVTISDWAEANDVTAGYVTGVIYGRTKLLGSKARRIAHKLGLIESLQPDPREVRFSYPTTASQVRSTLAAKNLRISEWAKANRLRMSSVERALLRVTPSPEKGVRAAQIKLGLIAATGESGA